MMMRKHINQIHTAVTVRKKRKKRSAEEEAEEKRLIKEAKQNVARHATAWVENVPYHGKKLLQERFKEFGKVLSVTVHSRGEAEGDHAAVKHAARAGWDKSSAVRGMRLMLAPGLQPPQRQTSEPAHDDWDQMEGTAFPGLGHPQKQQPPARQP